MSGLERAADGIVAVGLSWELLGRESLHERAASCRPRALSDDLLRLSEDRCGEDKRCDDAASEASTAEPQRLGSFSDCTASDADSPEPSERRSRREGHAKRQDLWSPPDEEAVQDDARTTLVIQQLPGRAGRRELCELLDAEGFAGGYDFLYAPVNFKALQCFGYSFVNFVDHPTAARALSHFHGRSWCHADEEKVLDVAWSDPHQGRQVHVERFRNSPVMHHIVPDEYKPLLLQDGVRVVFPPPTRKVVPPRDLRRRQRA